jgi:hypothetical protein
MTPLVRVVSRRTFSELNPLTKERVSRVMSLTPRRFA